MLRQCPCLRRCDWTAQIFPPLSRSWSQATAVSISMSIKYTQRCVVSIQHNTSNGCLRIRIYRWYIAAMQQFICPEFSVSHLCKGFVIEDFRHVTAVSPPTPATFTMTVVMMLFVAASGRGNRRPQRWGLRKEHSPLVTLTGIRQQTTTSCQRCEATTTGLRSAMSIASLSYSRCSPSRLVRSQHRAQPPT
jgi:hypothetical protein